MRNLMKLAAAGLVALGTVSTGAFAAEGKVREYLHNEWSWKGPMGGFDRDQIQRGYAVYRNVCSACHSMRLVAFRHLAEEGGPYYLEECPKELGLPDTVDCSDPVQNPIVKSLASEFTVTDGPD